MHTTAPALQLDKFTVLRLLIDWRPPTVPVVDVDHLKCDFSYDVATHKQEPRRYRMILDFKMEEVGKQQAGTGYVIEARLEGQFTFDESFEETKRQIAVRISGLNMLYGSLRGVLAGITGTFPGGTITLPSIKPQSVVEDVEKRKLAQNAKPTVPAPKVRRKSRGSNAAKAQSS